MAKRKKYLGVNINWMIPRDMPAVMDIERRSFKDPWSKKEFRQYQRLSCKRVVAKLGKKVVGFVIYESYQNYFYVVNFAVHPEYRRRGVGTQIIRWLISKLTCRACCHTVIILEVRETNLPAQLLFKSQGFRAVGYSQNTTRIPKKPRTNSCTNSRVLSKCTFRESTGYPSIMSGKT